MNFNYSGHELFISQIQDQIRLSELRYSQVVTSFLTPVEQEIINQIVSKNIFVSMYGGHIHAQRKVAVFSPFESKCDYEISILSSKFDSRFKSITHRDVLGVLMNLGIEREVLGDLIVEEDRIVIFCKEYMSDYIIDNCTKISSCSISFKRLDQVEINTPLYEEIFINSSSLRIDAVVSSLANVSRSDAQALIKRGYVKLNDVVLETHKQLCNNDFVSIRRCGRFKFVDIKSTTKKNRLVLRFEKFI